MKLELGQPINPFKGRETMNWGEDFLSRSITLNVPGLHPEFPVWVMSDRGPLKGTKTSGVRVLEAMQGPDDRTIGLSTRDLYQSRFVPQGSGLRSDQQFYFSNEHLDILRRLMVVAMLPDVTDPLQAKPSEHQLTQRRVPAVKWRYFAPASAVRYFDSSTLSQLSSEVTPALVDPVALGIPEEELTVEERAGGLLVTRFRDYLREVQVSFLLDDK